MRRVLVAACCAAVLAPTALAAAPTNPVYDARGRLVDTPFAPTAVKPQLTKQRALALLLARHNVSSWLAHYPRRQWTTEETFDQKQRTWTVRVWTGAAGEMALGTIDDASGRVLEAWAGPQVAWTMARGSNGAFGGKRLNSRLGWLGFCGLFLLGLVDWRRPLSLRNLDLLALLSFSVSLWFFNRGNVFASAPLVYPGFLYLIARMTWVGTRGRVRPWRPIWPVWLLAAVAVFGVGFRIALNVRTAGVIDVGYSGVIGAQRIASGEMPYGHMPTDDAKLKPCAPAGADGVIAYRIQTNGRCESQDSRGDTYGPISYQAYLPGYWILGWKGKGDHLDAARFTSVLFDVLCIVGLALVGRRFGGAMLAAILPFAWVAYPFTEYSMNANTNDAIMPAFLIWGFWLVTRPAARGIFVALATWTKYAAVLVAPLWATYPEVRRGRRQKLVFVAAFVLTTLASFWVLVLEPSLPHAVKVFYERGIRWQIGRESPFSIWDWRQYHHGLPDLQILQKVLEGLLLLGALVAPFVPRRKSPLQLAALTAALLIGFEVVLTHWFYLYIAWFFPFVAIVVLAGATRRQAPQAPEPREREHRELAVTG